MVSDHTFIEVVTNWGGVLGGTGSSSLSAGPSIRISNTTVELLRATGKAFLFTSNTHVGQYEVLAACTLSPFGDSINSKPPVTAQVTVTCTKAAATTITAPNTGTGTIRPPNTGDAGLAAPASRRQRHPLRHLRRGSNRACRHAELRLRPPLSTTTVRS